MHDLRDFNGDFAYAQPLKMTVDMLLTTTIFLEFGVVDDDKVGVEL